MGVVEGFEEKLLSVHPVLQMRDSVSEIGLTIIFALILQAAPLHDGSCFEITKIESPASILDIIDFIDSFGGMAIPFSIFIPATLPDQFHPVNIFSLNSVNFLLTR